MKRVCFIGNSHVGAIKKATDDLKVNGKLAGVDVSIFGSHSDSLKSVEVKDGYLISDSEQVKKNFHWTSGGSTKVKISDYNEIFFVVGASLFDVKKFQTGMDIPFISSDLASLLIDMDLKQWPMKLAENTARESDNVQVTHIGTPFISAEAPESKALLSACNDPQSGASRRLADLRALLETKYSEVSGGNFRIMKPLTAALEEHGLFTQHIYCQNSVRLTKDMNITHPAKDFVHMNADYGRLLLEHLLA